MPTPTVTGASEETIEAVRRLGAAALIDVSASAQSPLRYGKMREGMYFVVIQREGSCLIGQSGRAANLTAGDIAIYSGDLPYQHLTHAVFRQTVLVLPAAALRRASPDIDHHTARAISGRLALAGLLAAMADAHFRMDEDELPEKAANHAMNALLETVAACVLLESAVPQAGQSKMGHYHLNRIRRYAMEHLGDVELSVASVAAALDISAAHLHRLFGEEEHTFSAWLWEARLSACHAALRNPEYARHAISQIAFQHGFSQAAHFSRAFRRRYGMTASEWRNASAD